VRFHETLYAVYGDAGEGDEGCAGDIDKFIESAWREAVRPWWVAGSGGDGVRRPVSLPT
jgi:hypothetical protein